MKTQSFLFKAISTLAVSFCATVANAQQTIAPPPYNHVDENGVNLATGKLVLPGANVGIGGEGSGLRRSVNENSDNFVGRLGFGYIYRSSDGELGPTQLTMDASLNGSILRFHAGGGNNRATATVSGPGPFSQINGTAKLACTGDYTQRFAGGTCTITLGNGVLALYSVPSGSDWLLQSLTQPDGEVQSFTYDGSNLRAVSSSLGWMIKYEISGSTTTIKAINSGVVYCDPAAPTCAVSTSFPQVTQTTSGGTTTIVRNGTPLGSYTVSGSTTTVTSPSGVTKTVVTTNGKVSSVSKGGQTWSYAYVGSAATRTNPDGTTFQVNLGMYGVSSVKDENNVYKTFEYDSSFGNLLSVREFGDVAPTTTFVRDSRGNITSETVTPQGGGTPLVTTAVFPTTCTNFKTCNKPTSITQPNGVTTTYTYDPNHGGLLTETTPAVNGIQAQKRYTYSQYTPSVKNSAGVSVAQPPVWRVTQVASCMTAHLAACAGTADELRITKGYQHLIPYTTTTKRGDGSLAQTTTATINNNGWTTAVDGPRAGTVDKTFMFYDTLGRKLGDISPDPDGAGARSRSALRFTYDVDGRVSKTERGVVGGTTAADLAAMTVQSYETFEFSATHGLPVVARHYEGSTLTALEQKSYDSRLRLDCQAERLNSSVYSTITSTPACSLGPASPDGNDRIIKYSYSPIGMVSSVISAYGTPVPKVEFTNTFNNNRTLSSVLDGKSNRTNYFYDNFARQNRICYALPSNGSATNSNDCSQTVFNANGTVGSFILRNSQTINLGYDALGRVSTKSGAVSENFTYDNFHRVVTHTANGASETFSYNSLGWLLSDAQPAGTVTYAYDANGRRSQLIYPGGFNVTYALDDLDNLTALTPSSGSGSISIDYDDFVRRWHINRGNGQTTTYGYDGLARLGSITHGSANTQTFGYTPADQIRSKSDSNSAFTPAPPDTATTNYAIDALNRVAMVGNVSIGYDGRGNLTTDSSGSYSYSPANLMTSATQGGATATLGYDAQSRLQSITKSGITTKFLYDGHALIAEYDGAGNLLRRYVHGSQIGEPLVWLEGGGGTDPRFFHANEVGSITSVSDSAGTTRSINTYDPYGARSTSNTSYSGRFGFTGQAFLPEIGLHYFKARMYSASFGRFMQTDPIGYGDGINWYAYVKNDPINRSDPLGLDGVDGLSDYRTVGAYDSSSLPEIIVSACGITCSHLRTLADAFINRLFQTTPLAPLPLPQGPQQDPRCKRALPDGRNVNENTREIRMRLAIEKQAGGTGLDTFAYWFSMVAPGGRWDYKVHGGTQAQGNFNFGATSSALFSEYVTKNGAGVVQLTLGDTSVSEGVPLFKPPFGDQPSDAQDVGSGYNAGCG